MTIMRQLPIGEMAFSTLPLVALLSASSADQQSVLRYSRVGLEGTDLADDPQLRRGVPGEPLSEYDLGRTEFKPTRAFFVGELVSFRGRYARVERFSDEESPIGGSVKYLNLLLGDKKSVRVSATGKSQPSHPTPTCLRSQAHHLQKSARFAYRGRWDQDRLRGLQRRHKMQNVRPTKSAMQRQRTMQRRKWTRRMIHRS